MSPELKLYYEGLKISDIARTFRISDKIMRSRLYHQRIKIGSSPRKPLRKTTGIEFENDKAMILELVKSGMSNVDIADKWEVSLSMVSRHMKKWGVEWDKRAESLSLSELYTGWADIPQGKEMLLTVNKRPMFKLVRII